MPDLRHIAILLGLVLLVFAWLPTGVSAPNERSRIYLAISMIDDHTVAIDGAVERFGTIADRAERDGSLYSDKAPGSSILAAAVYGFVRLFTDAGDWTIEGLLLLFRFGLMVPITVAGFFILRRILRDLGLDPPVVAMTSISWLVATPVLHYGQAFYGHQIAAVALLGSVALLLQRKPRIWHLAIAGALAGIAGMTEYQAAIPCVLLAFWVLSGPSRKKPLELVAFFGAALPFAVILLAYHNAAFGGPFELSYHHLQDAALHERHTRGIGGVSWPLAEAFYGSFFSLHRGLFLTAPIFLLSFLGWRPLAQKIGRRQTAFIAAILLFFALFITSSNTWFAGWSYGPRLLVPAMAIATLPMAFGLQAIRNNGPLTVFAIFAFVVGLASNLAMKLTFFEAPNSTTNPLVDVAYAIITEGYSTPTLATSLGLSPTTSHLIAAAVAVVLVVLVSSIYLQKRRLQPLLIAIGACLLFFFAVFGVGPDWNPTQEARFETIMERTLVAE